MITKDEVLSSSFVAGKETRQLDGEPRLCYTVTRVTVRTKATFGNSSTPTKELNASQYRQLLSRFDPPGLDRYGITAADLQHIERYIRILQSGLNETVWDEAIQIGGPCGVSILIHEIVEIRALRKAGIDPYRYTQKELAHVLADNLVAHVVAIYEEHLYLQDVLLRQYGCRFEIATLIKANRADDTDLNYFLESDIGVFLLEQERVKEARMYLEQLRQEEL